MKKVVGCLLAIVVLMLAGCSGDGYYHSKIHYSARSENPVSSSNDSDAISDIASLKSAVKNTIDARKSEEKLVIKNYDGDWSADLQEISKEMEKVYPYGSYAIAHFGYTQNTIFAQTEITLNITYKDSAKNRREILEVPDNSDFERRLKALMSSFSNKPPSEDYISRAYLFNNFTDTAESFETRIMKCWADNADTAIELRSVSFSFFPDDNSEQGRGPNERIVEITLQFMEDFATLEDMSNEIDFVARQMVEDVEAEGDLDKIEFVYRLLWNQVEFIDTDENVVIELEGRQPKKRSFTAYGGLVEKQAEQSGYVLSAHALLKRLGMESRVIIGWRGEIPYYWLYVKVEGRWMHFDPTAEIIERKRAQEEEAGGAVQLEETEPVPEDFSTHKYLFTPAEAKLIFTWPQSVYGIYIIG